MQALHTPWFSSATVPLSHCYKVKVTQSCLILCDPMDFTVHGILQARILEWAAFPFSRGSSWPRNQTGVSCITGGFFTIWTIRPLTKSFWVGYSVLGGMSVLFPPLPGKTIKLLFSTSPNICLWDLIQNPCIEAEFSASGVCCLLSSPVDHCLLCGALGSVLRVAGCSGCSWLAYVGTCSLSGAQLNWRELGYHVSEKLVK